VASVPTRQLATAQQTTIFYCYILNNQAFNLVIFAVANCRVETLATGAYLMFGFLLSQVGECDTYAIYTSFNLLDFSKKSIFCQIISIKLEEILHLFVVFESFTKENFAQKDVYIA
jgi:hypothetical protein